MKLANDLACTSLPEPVAETLRRHHEGGVGPEACAGCASPCCSRGGYAIIENVLLIYELYRAGKLERDDYQFVGGLSFKDFVDRYFHVEVRTVGRNGGSRGLALFHMKSLAPGGHVITIPAEGDHGASRDRLFDQNHWLNKGCVFLSESLSEWRPEDGRLGRGCILHDPAAASQVTAKPIGCVLATCAAPLQGKPLDEEAEQAWLEALAEAFPGSVEHYEALRREE